MMQTLVSGSFFMLIAAKTEWTKKQGEQIICSPRHCAAVNAAGVLGCYLPEFVALPADSPLALGMLK